MSILYQPGQALVALSIALSAVGCVSIDSRALREQSHPSGVNAVSGTYRNDASYRSSGEFVASQTLSSALGLEGLRATRVTVSRPSESLLRLEFDTAPFPTVRTYALGSGMLLRPDGRFDVAVPVGCGGRDSPGFGCGTKTVTIFSNLSGDLCAVESGGGAGLIGIIPFALYSKQLAVFSRVKE